MPTAPPPTCNAPEDSNISSDCSVENDDEHDEEEETWSEEVDVPYFGASYGQ